MKGTIKKWGNSLAWRIPKDIAQQFDLEDGKKISISIDNNSITIRPEEVFTIDDFMVGLREDNRHDEIETDYVGKEKFWEDE